jgi:hypothetical protein
MLLCDAVPRSAISQRKGDISFVLERKKPAEPGAAPGDVVPIGFEKNDCDAVGLGSVGQTAFSSRPGRMGLLSFANDAGAHPRSKTRPKP